MSKIYETAEYINNTILWYNHHAPTLIDKDGKLKDFEQTLKFMLRLQKEYFTALTYLVEAVDEAAKRQDLPELVLPKGVKLDEAIRSETA